MAEMVGLLTAPESMEIIFNDDSSEDPIGACNSRATVQLADADAGRMVSTDLMRLLTTLGVASADASLGWVGLLVSLAGGKDQVAHYDYHQNFSTFELSVNDDRVGTCSYISATGQRRVRFMGPMGAAQRTLSKPQALQYAQKKLGDGEYVVSSFSAACVR